MSGWKWVGVDLNGQIAGLQMGRMQTDGCKHDVQFENSYLLVTKLQHYVIFVEHKP